jgi:DNA-binding CsgD family transcriptional regulator
MFTPVATERDKVAAPPRMGASGFVGRARELDVLTSALTLPSALVLVEGEAGVGKTRLVQKYLASDAARQLRPLVTCCPPFRQPLTLGPVADALRDVVPDVSRLPLSGLAGALRPLFPEWAGSLPPPPEAAEDAGVARHRLFRALEELLGCCRVRLLVAEDVHWADDATVEFLLFLATRQPRAVSLIVTCRPEDVPDGSLLPRLTSRLAAGAGGCRITLGPLDLAATTGLVSSMLSGERVSEEFAEFVYRRTEGLPLAVEELIRLMASRAEIFHYGDGWVRRSLEVIQVPPTIRDAVLERARRLDGEAQAVLRAAAVLGAPADETVIRSVARVSSERARAGLSTATECGLLGEGARGLVSYRHALACQAVYEAVPGPERRMLHRRAGRALENASPRPVTRLARHFREAGDTGKWCRYGEQAAELALASGDEAAAGELLHDLIVNAGLPADVVVGLTRKLRFGALPGQASFQDLIGALRSLLATGTLTSEEEAGLRVQLGQALAHRQEWAQGRVELERAVPHLGHDPLVCAQAMILLGWPRGTTCPAGVHIGWLRRAATLPAPDDPADRLHLAVDRVSALLMLGEEEGWAEAGEIPLDAPTARGRSESIRSHLNLGDQAVRWGRYEEAAWRLDRAVDLARSHDYWRLHEDAAVTRMLLDWVTGAWDGLAERAARPAADDEPRVVTKLAATLVLGLLDAAAGAQSQAADRLSLVLAELGQRAEVEYTMEPAAALARLRLAEGKPGEAVVLTDGPAGIVAAKGIWVWATDLAPARVAALAAVGRIGAAEDLVAEFERGLGRRDAPAPQAGLALCRAVLAEAQDQPARAAELFARAAAAWHALPRPYDELLARERQAGCLLTAGRETEALDLLAEVLRRLSRLGAAGDADRVAGVLREHGVVAHRAWHRGRRGYGGRLSPRELEVVRMVLSGLTNPEIAQALSRSPKTVAAQLNSAMRKFGVTSRTALAVKAVEAGVMTQATEPPADPRTAGQAAGPARGHGIL